MDKERLLKFNEIVRQLIECDKSGKAAEKLVEIMLLASLETMVAIIKGEKENGE